MGRKACVPPNSLPVKTARPMAAESPQKKVAAAM